MDVNKTENDVHVTSEEFKDRIYREIVDFADGEPRIKPQYKQIFEPYASAGYPLSQVGLLARVTRKYIGNWINFPRLTGHLSCIKDIGSFFDEKGFSVKERMEIVKDVVSRIGTESYTKEWNTVAASAQLEDVIESSTGITHSANNMLAKTIESNVLAHFSGPRHKDMLSIMDVGVGFGSTTLPVVKMLDNLARERRIPADYENFVKLYLVDVSERALHLTYHRLLSELRTQGRAGPGDYLSNVISMPLNFADIVHNPDVINLKDSLDIIVSGAAICHQTDLQPFFKTMHDLLRYDGVMKIWDWYNGPSFAAPYLKLSKNDERRAIYRVSDCRDVALDQNDGKTESDKPFGWSEKINSVYEITEHDAIVVLANFKTLLGILGYTYNDKHSDTRARKMDGINIDEYLDGAFAKGIKSNQGFSYFEFLKDTVPKLDNPNPQCTSAYYLIEGYGDDYSVEMKKAGFREAEDRYFIDVYGKLKNSAGKSHTDAVPAFQIRYTFAKK